MEEQRQEQPVSVKSDSSQSRHHSSHHHSHKKSGKRSKFSRFLKKHKSVIINVVVILVAIAAVVLMGLFGDRLQLSGPQLGGQDVENTKPTGSEELVTTVQMEVSHFSGDVMLVPSAVHSFANRDMTASLLQVIDHYKDPETRLDIGLPVSLSYSVNGIPSGLTIKGTTLEVADTLDFTKPRVYTSTQAAATVHIYHLQTDKTYYYRVGVTLSDNTTTYTIGTFKTAQSPRLLTIGGIVNVRDVGGWKTTDGKTVRQGLLYRGSELDGAVEPSFKLTADGRNDMLTVLGIRMEMDLRSPDNNVLETSPLGANVTHTYYSAGDYSRIFMEGAHEATRRVFSDLANSNHYPIYMHCTYGADRTGTMCYLLLTLLGVSEEDALRDYELSAMYYSWANTESMSQFIRELHSFPGETMQEKVEFYLVSIGVTQQEIADIRAILLAY